MNRAMKIVRTLAVILLSFSTRSFCQTFHPVTPDTKGNRIELTVANTSATVAAESIVVMVTKAPSHLKIIAAHQTIRVIRPGKEEDAVFTFDVDRGAPANKRDTLEFSLRDKSGFAWTKSITVQYTGPTTFALDQNFPNPFNPSTTIYYQLPKDSRVGLKVFDLLGREVSTLVNEDRPAGYHDAKWNAANVASGVYFYRMEAKPLDGGQGFQQVKKLMVVK